jgi:tetratricopeptide (TPR) repeat protein
MFSRLKLYLRYLYEIGDYEVSGRVIETGIEACEDKTSLLYARLVDTAGSRFSDLNRLSDCRNAWETALKIRRERLSHDSPLSKYTAPPIFLVYVLNVSKVAGIYNNLGNLETASGNLAESRDYFERATLIWVAGGDATAYQLALTYLCVGRMHMLQGNFREAEKNTALSESMFVRIGAPPLAMAQ